MKNSIRNLLVTLALLCTSAALAFSQGVAYSGSPVINGVGQPIAGASVAITTSNPCGGNPSYSSCNGLPQGVYSGSIPPSNLATLYTDVTAGSSTANPLTSDAFGNWTAYLAAGGTYWAVFYGGQIQASVQAFTVGVLTNATPYPNSSGGTTCNGLAKVDQTMGATTLGKAVNTAAGDQVPTLGVVVSGCGTTGNASIVASGQVQLIFDTASISVGNAVGISVSNDSQGTDLGSPAPTGSARIVGTIILSPSGALPAGCTSAPGCWILYNPAAAGGGSGSSPNAVITNPGSTVANSIQPTSPTAQGITIKAPASAGSTLPVEQILDNAGNQIYAAMQNGSNQLGKTGDAPSIGSNTSGNTDLDGELTMSSGTATYTFIGAYGSHPTCIASDETSIAAVKVTYTGVVSVTFTTSGSTDVISYHCLYRN